MDTSSRSAGRYVDRQISSPSVKPILSQSLACVGHSTPSTLGTQAFSGSLATQKQKPAFGLIAPSLRPRAVTEDPSPRMSRLARQGKADHDDGRQGESDEEQPQDSLKRRGLETP